MNKTELIDAIASQADLPKAAAARALDAFIDSVTGALKAGDSVTLVGFVSPCPSYIDTAEPPGIPIFNRYNGNRQLTVKHETVD